MADIILLKQELDGDPLIIGYAGMTGQQVTDSLNALSRQRNRTSISGDEIFNAIDSRATWDGLTAENKTLFVSFCGRDNIDPFAAGNVEFIKAIFGNTSATITNLAALRVEPVSRGVEIGFGYVELGHVLEARL